MNIHEVEKIPIAESHVHATCYHFFIKIQTRLQSTVHHRIYPLFTFVTENIALFPLHHVR